MEFKINIREEAVQDLIKGYLWYEEQKKGPGENFASEVESSLRKSLSELNLKTFPYLIIYSVEDSLVTVLAIFHSHLNPNKKPSA